MSAYRSNIYNKNNYYAKWEGNSKLIKEKEKKSYILRFQHITIRPSEKFKIKWNESQKQTNILKFKENYLKRLGVSCSMLGKLVGPTRGLPGQCSRYG